MSKEVRQSNFELMRIISILFIIIYHIVIHSGIYNYSVGTSKIMLTLINAIIVVHVNSFALLSGYFQSNSKFKMHKVLQINGLAWFYELLFLITFLLLGKFGIYNKYISVVEIVETIIPLDFGVYWFINCYLVTYILSPFINIMIEHLDEKKFKMVIFIMFIIFSVLPTFTLDKSLYTNNGRSLFTFIFLYFIGAYLRIYPVDNKNFLNSKTKYARKKIFTILYMLFAFLNFLIEVVGNELVKYGALTSQVGNIMIMATTNFLGPFVVIESIFYFLIFTQFDLKSKFINFVAKSTLSIYLIHENIYVRENLYNYLGLTSLKNIDYKIVIIIIALAIIIFIISFIIDILRRLLSKFIMNSKPIKYFNSKIKKKCVALGLDISW